jgi:RimJ/RimL family protein N-acetyltransferase
LIRTSEINKEIIFKFETKHLILRDMKPEDEKAFVAISQESKYQRFYSESDCDADKYRQLTRLFIEQANEHPRTAYELAIEYKATGDFIGTVCLRLEADNQAAMGCGMARAYQGHGLIHEATYALMNFGFHELGVHRFFKQQWWDTVVLAVLQSEWKQI